MPMIAKLKPLATIALAIAGVALYAQGQAPQGQPGQQPPAGQGRGRGGGGFRQPDPYDFDEHDGWTSLFDGKTLNGWSGDNNWKVEDGAIVVEPSCEHPTGTIY